MKTQIRNNVFETNSSSCHSLCVCTAKDYDLWEKGKKVYDNGNKEIVARFPGMNDDYILGYPRYQTKKQYDSYISQNVLEAERMYQEFIAPDGTEMVVFGWAGRI